MVNVIAAFVLFYFFAQVGKDAVIVDERFNGGGKAADWVIDHLARPLINFWTTRYGDSYSTPAGQIFGPKVMIVNEQAGSGGDYLKQPAGGSRMPATEQTIRDRQQLVDSLLAAKRCQAQAQATLALSPEPRPPTVKLRRYFND